jgi:hypothetical protein
MEQWQDNIRRVIDEVKGRALTKALTGARLAMVETAREANIVDCFHSFLFV